MKWRPRISIPLGKGFRINIGKRGIGASGGIPGVARLGVGADGRTRTTLGRGLFRWEKQSGGTRGCGSGGCGGCLGLVAIAFLLLSLIAVLLPENSRDSPSDKRPTSSAAVSPLLTSKVPLFVQPTLAAAIPLELGLSDTAPNLPAWRESEDHWYALATITTYTGKLTKVGDVDNTITCFHESKQSAQIDRVTWTANVFNPDGQAATLPRFRQLCLRYTARLGCAVPAELFQDVSPDNGQQLETREAHFIIEKLSYAQGFGWRFRITSK
jgi:hypothetical protein